MSECREAGHSDLVPIKARRFWINPILLSLMRCKSYRRTEYFRRLFRGGRSIDPRTFFSIPAGTNHGIQSFLIQKNKYQILNNELAFICQPANNMASRLYMADRCDLCSETAVWVQSLTALVRHSRLSPDTRQALTQPPSTLPNRGLSDPSQLPAYKGTRLM
ncbi:hypothetical protein GX50_08204 [[Emmonsia] crescens]|uniref:Uncharacterized protein n=1 Tax=[Emmonsia] crescens TaxID=73230 RepID=A0A2B7Z564_9EURO|nr:hypothetical protein GX50_08204 [Emmonsia crescens]